jgi:large conductance mechanosensitive channel
MEKPVKVTPKAKAKGFINGFKNFITRGNVVDMAIGVIIGGAFGKIVSSLINDIILPPIGFLLGGVAFKDLKINIAQQTIGGVPQFDANNNPIFVTINYGNFIQVVLEFLIMAFCIYLLLFFIIKRKQYEEQIILEELAKQQVEEEEKPVEVPEDIKLLTEIRDLLKKSK